jgi:hypothetical protein
MMEFGLNWMRPRKPFRALNADKRDILRASAKRVRRAAKRLCVARKSNDPVWPLWMEKTP